MDLTMKVYNYMKSLSDQNGYAPTVRQTAEKLQLKESEVERSIQEMQRQGKIVVTEIPAKSIIEFAD
ncbi:MAG: hypothetical protein HFH34_15945 [Eubacterium sp.]|jgi:DNA-binding MarR family transcriptional regulator|nr:hypothetical protein [Eubacterium sp.]